MNLDPELLQKVKRKKLDEVEAEWNSRVESTPRDLPWFLAVAREMRAAKAHVKMVELLMLLSDGLAVDDAWEESFEALREGIALAGSVIARPDVQTIGPHQSCPGLGGTHVHRRGAPGDPAPLAQVALEVEAQAA